MFRRRPFVVDCVLPTMFLSCAPPTARPMTVVFDDEGSRFSHILSIYFISERYRSPFG